MNKLSSEQVVQLTEIAKHLQQKRLDLDIPLEQIALRTQIRLGILKALEDGQFELLPEPVFLQGFIRLYGNALQLDGNALAKSFQTQPPPPPPPPEPEPPREQDSKLLEWSYLSNNLRPYFPYVPYALLLLLAVCALLWLVRRKPNEQVTQAPQLSEVRPSPSPTVTPTAPTPTVSPTPTVTPTVPTPTATPTPTVTPTPTPSLSPTPTQEQSQPISLQVKFTDASWVRISVDGKTEFEGILEAGEQKTWQADEQIRIRAGNAGAISFSQNQEPFQPLGKPGEVREITLTP